MEKRSLNREIKRFLGAKAHLRRLITVEDLLKDSRSFFLSEVAARNKKIHDATDGASRLGDELKPRNFTEFFADKPDPQSLVALRKYTLPVEIKTI